MTNNPHDEKGAPDACHTRQRQHQRIIAFRDKTLWATLICAGLAFLSAAVIYLA
jgi:hypothetical protein